MAGPEDVEMALVAAERGAAVWRRTPAHERMTILLRAADLADQRAAKIARIISSESGKTITEATGEAARSGDLIRLAAFEGTQLYGETLPLDANRGTGLDKVGFTLRQPCGVVVAITPFNYPALLVLHKLAPALAAGNAVVLKPATSTPLTALELVGCFVDALVTDPRVRKISFTGSTATGEHISSPSNWALPARSSCCPTPISNTHPRSRRTSSTPSPPRSRPSGPGTRRPPRRPWAH
ncbi:aldehyde dehydrogenase family protein [Streptomyces scopuliridis]|uniref:aldehyde dehydrogenase family protein n=1 Tax=Streptomyces scopuliridis TaxID=452529 RepID=UPI0036B335BA